SYGVTFRHLDDENFYHFEVDLDGQYRLQKNEANEWVNITDWIPHSAIKKAGQVNKLAVVARGSTIELYANGTKLGTYQDSSFSHGNVGLVVATYDNGGVHVTFDGLVVSAVK
ncbi:MAG: hypothetical protein ACUVX9_13275, partial [Anaerolineae bacterium]